MEAINVIDWKRRLPFIARAPLTLAYMAYIPRQNTAYALLFGWKSLMSSFAGV
jgi:hypothetical protein